MSKLEIRNSEIEDKTKIGVVGSVWAAGTIQLAVQEPKLAACVVNYGALPTNAADIQKIRPPVLGKFGGQHRGIPVGAVYAFEKAMKDAGKTADAKMYDDAGHAFEIPTTTKVIGRTTQRMPGARTLGFFSKTRK